MATITFPAEKTHVLFNELPDLIAKALHPENLMAWAGAVINLEEELKQAVKVGALAVKDPLTLGPHTFPVGNALQTAVVAIDDLRTFLAGRCNVVVEAQAGAPADVVSGSPQWVVTKPQRYSGYTSPLYRFLMAAQLKRKACPSARDVIEEWRVNKPAEIAQVMTDEVNYYDAQGNIKGATLNSIRKAIKRMTSAR